MPHSKEHKNSMLRSMETQIKLQEVTSLQQLLKRKKIKSLSKKQS